MQSHLIEVLIKSGIPFCQTKTLSSGSCAESSRSPSPPNKHQCRYPPSPHPPNTTQHHAPQPGAAMPEKDEPIGVDWHFDWLVKCTSPSPAASMLIIMHNKVGGPLALDLVHPSIFERDRTRGRIQVTRYTQGK